MASASSARMIPTGTVLEWSLNSCPPRITKEGAAPLLIKRALPVSRSASIRSTVVKHSPSLPRIKQLSISSAPFIGHPAISSFSKNTAEIPLVSAASRPLPIPSETSV